MHGTMLKHYLDYHWVNGKPYGTQTLEKSPIEEQLSFRIVADPYYKRISVEKYKGSHFFETIYDSALLDFRHLKPVDQNAWSKEVIEQSPTQIVALLRNQDDRTLYIETCVFEGLRCRECRIQTVQQIPVSTHKMYYKALGDRFDGVVLYDNSGRPVMFKTYTVHPETGEFADLEKEEWKLDKNQTPV